jgi:putative membrane protein
MMVDRLLAPFGLAAADLPAVNATLNGVAAVFLVSGYFAIRARQIRLHKTCMVTAFLVSTLFLASYVYYHFVVKNGKATEFTVQGWPKRIYYSVLISHILLAFVVAVLAPITLSLGFGAPGNRHLKIARWTFPIWLYVSVTGVVVYLMLYRLYPPA